MKRRSGCRRNLAVPQSLWLRAWTFVLDLRRKGLHQRVADSIANLRCRTAELLLVENLDSNREMLAKVLFPDTNVFIHVRDLKDILWTDLFPGVQAVDVMIAPRVIQELDEYKTSTNQRRRDRARLALRLIDEASHQPEFALVLKEKPVRVRIVISTAPRFDWDAYPNLDPARPDDHLIAEALSFGNGAEIFSHDSGPRIRARIAKVLGHKPLDEWLLPIEQTDDQRKITKLERDLERALNRFPQVDAGFHNINSISSEIHVIRPILRPLDPKVIDDLSSDYLRKHPRASLRPATRGLMLQLEGITEHEVDRYNSDYSDFKTKVRNYYANLHQYMTSIGAAAEIGYFVRNDSSIAALGLRIEFDLEGDGSLLADRDDALPSRSSSELPRPPAQPRSISDYLRSTLSHIPVLRDSMQPRDPVLFYWYERPESPAKHSALQCEEFRATREYSDSIFVLPFSTVPAMFDLRMHISAANLPLR
jgi:hypothetical protein